MLLTGCYEPISNAAFVEDLRFTSSLPNDLLLGVPGPIAELDSADDPVLDASLDARDDYLEVVRTLAESGEALRRSSPDNRGADYRSWEPLPVASTGADGVDSWWIRADVIDTGEGVMASTIEVADSQDGPWTTVGEGWSDPSGRGSFDWELAWWGDNATLVVEHRQEDYGRDVSIERRGGPIVVGNVWGLYGDAAMGMTLDAVSLTDDGEAWPASAGVLHTPQGGRADGQIFTNAGELVYHVCWNGSGQRTYAGGDAGVNQEGSAASCVGEPLFTGE